ncbi:hypothetical protein E2C01_078808 [Portunus trituberculatus]|uniref:Uncharacterized protein n=1 Tax=Portunus trituberculatus TaxID=210409 RepID=A0A5B7IJT6_PORTR|nr:hypothetical protein [Portunus trituberculatus]
MRPSAEGINRSNIFEQHKLPLAFSSTSVPHKLADEEAQEEEEEEEVASKRRQVEGQRRVGSEEKEGKTGREVVNNIFSPQVKPPNRF